MARTSGAVYDRRNNFRVQTGLSCCYTHGGLSHKAVVLDLSLKGALLSSEFMPRNDETIVLVLTIPVSNAVLNLEAKVVRRILDPWEHSAVGKFGVRFSNTPMQLLTFLSGLK